MARTPDYFAGKAKEYASYGASGILLLIGCVNVAMLLLGEAVPATTWASFQARL